MDTVFSEDDDNSIAKGACKEGTPSAEEMNEEQHMDTANLSRRNIVFDVAFEMVKGGGGG